MDSILCPAEYFDEDQYEFVLIRTANGESFARLVSIFMIVIDEKPYPLALVQPLAPYSGPKVPLDEDMEFLRLSLQPRDFSHLVLVDSIIRRAALVWDKVEEYIAVDVMDGDMLLRVKDMLI